MQKISVVVQFLASFKCLKVADHVPENKCEEYDTAYCHHDFFAVCGLPKAGRATSRTPITVVAILVSCPLDC